ncbi:MAG: ATP-dependent protease LonB, partial [Haloplanus sp.]
MNDDTNTDERPADVVEEVDDDPSDGGADEWEDDVPTPSGGQEPGSDPGDDSDDRSIEDLGSDVQIDAEIDEDEEDGLLGGLQIDSTAEIKVPDRLVDQVIGQEHARDVVMKAAKQRRHVMMIGSPG